MGVLKIRFINMEADLNPKTSACCSSQLDSRSKEGRRNVDTVGRKDTTRTEVTTENSEVKKVVSSSTNDVHQKGRLRKVLGKLPTTKRGPSAVPRNNLAKEKAVRMMSKMNPKLQPPVGSYPAKAGTVLLNILTRLMPKLPSLSTPVGSRTVLLKINLVVSNNHSSSKIRNPSVVLVYNPKPSACAPSVLYVLYKRNPLPHTPATELQETAILLSKAMNHPEQ